MLPNGTVKGLVASVLGMQLGPMKGLGDAAEGIKEREGGQT